MVNGFQEETQELSEFELQAAEIVKTTLNGIGDDYPIKSQELEKELWSHGYLIRGARIRKIIHHLRISGQVKNLIATSHGYYTTNDPKAIKKYIASLTQRSNAILSVRDSFHLTNSATTNPN
jgi:hypothetical protein